MQTFRPFQRKMKNFQVGNSPCAVGHKAMAHVVSLKGNTVSILSMAQLLAARVWQVSAPSPGEFRMDFGHKMVTHGHGALAPITYWDAEKYFYSFSENLTTIQHILWGEKKNPKMS